MTSATLAKTSKTAIKTVSLCVVMACVSKRDKKALLAQRIALRHAAPVSVKADNIIVQMVTALVSATVLVCKQHALKLNRLAQRIATEVMYVLEMEFASKRTKEDRNPMNVRKTAALIRVKQMKSAMIIMLARTKYVLKLDSANTL
jgi:hypothetical protein